MFEAADALAGGTLDMMQGNGILFGGRGVKVGDIEFGMPYGYLIPEKTTFEDKANEIRRFYFEDGFADLLRAEYAKQGVYWLDMSINGPVPFLIGTKKAADAFQGTPDDLNGLVIRTDGLFMEWHNALGMTGVDMPPMDAYTGLQTGTVDAHIWDVSAFMGMGYEEVAPYWIRGEENDDIVVSIYVNMKVWNSLSADLQDALAKAAEDYYYKTLELYGEAMDGLQAKIADGTVIEVHMSDANLARHQEVAYQMWDEIAGRDEASAQAVKLFRAWRGIE
jgi:TRAP-type C4-dicarboxylate transport system substrate-binding protein